jgi:hypothetical protein
MDQYYVYEHVDPENDDLLYIGLGSYERAWLCRGSNRTKDHQKKLKELFAAGFTMADIVSIRASGLSKQAAIDFEYKEIQLYKPKFNKSSNPDWKYPSRFSNEVVSMIKALAKMGYGPQNTAFLMGGDKKKNAMTIWRLKND